MNTAKFLAVSLFAIVAAAAQADSSQRVIDFKSQRSHAEVQAEAARVSNGKPRAAARIDAAEAVRLGLTSHGEFGG